MQNHFTGEESENYHEEIIEEFGSDIPKINIINCTLKFKNKFFEKSIKKINFNENNADIQARKTKIRISTIIKDDQISPKHLIYSEIDSSESESNNVSSDVQTIMEMLKQVQNGNIQSVLSSRNKEEYLCENDSRNYKIQTEGERKVKKSLRSYLEDSD